MKNEFKTTKSWTVDEVLAVLRLGPTRVVFEKADKTARVMLCTRNQALIDQTIPPKPRTPGVEPYKQPPSDVLVHAVDLQAKAWRSFRVDCLLRDPEPSAGTNIKQ